MILYLDSETKKALLVNYKGVGSLESMVLRLIYLQKNSLFRVACYTLFFRTINGMIILRLHCFDK